ncbi:circularly permuted type 2 ATP-grasp protein [Peristeroidobacter soli]|uniref:circularly permuted type 2 ATP-grasp protein n=1 Tax=Peristeroidobacter soli TaxID=2497877 RepID=UPI00101CDB05|nr:circularly permuted type 2 ATP-grasp protein [Peristeroidobacter soli]
MSASLQTYTPDLQRYDELLSPDGSIRPHWRALVERLEQAGPDAVRRSADLARRLIVENGVTYNVYADPQGRDRLWTLDMLPVIMSAEEWQSIERGVIQRARLFDSVLADLYGPQRLLQEGTVPAEIAFGHPNYLWPCHGAVPRGGRWLYMYAADLARSPDGRWWVLSDRTQTPSGPGYALENRRIVSRVLSDTLDDLNVRPLSGAFASLRDGLLANVEDSEMPLAVVLTPGPFNETYFEHAYLARQLGFSLVEGSDLTVRDDTLYLKTLSGLKRVHAVLRRLDDDFCDPAELRADSALGVPGLLKVVRAGRVVLGNALGSGVIESAAWLGFLPSICEWLLGEPLQLPSVATWWCGERPALEEVLEGLDRLVIKPTFPNQRFEAVFGRDLTRDARARLIRRLRARPYAYVAQERLALSQTPVWRGTGLTGRALSLRVYAIAGPDGYQVIPGGMARIASDVYADVVSTQRGGGSKDVWVLGQGEEGSQITEIAPRSRLRNESLPSRVGENLYWLGRYATRCEDKIRLLRGTLALERRSEVWPRAVDTCRHLGVTPMDSDPAASLFDTQHQLGIAADLQRLQWSATQARGRLSAEHWRAIGVVQRQYHDASSSSSDVRETLDRLTLSCAALSGFAHDDMTQDDAWRLMMLGRRVERISFLAMLLSRRLSEAAPTRGELEWILDIASGTIAYRTRYFDRPRLAPLLQLLVRDAKNPRSLAFLGLEICAITQQLSESAGELAVDFFQQAVTETVEADYGALEGLGYSAELARQGFARALNRMVDAASLLSDRLSMRHFSHTELDRHAVTA